MAITYTGGTQNQTELQEIQREIYSDWGTFRDMDIDISEGHKSGTDVYESSVAVGMKAYTGAAVTAGSDSLSVSKSSVTTTKVEFSDLIDYNSLLDTRFERSMAKGAFNTVSNEFDNAVLQQITPAISQTVENDIWNGATTATKAAIAALTPGAAQGSISAGAQTLIAAAPTNLIDSLPTVILHNNSNAKVTPGAGLGDYKKVLSIATIDASSIAAEYAKLYGTLDPKVLANEKVVIFAPLAHRQLMMIANNSVGAASNKNFVFSGEGIDAKAFYNGIEVKFKPLEGFIIAAPSKYLKILMDLAGDVSRLEVDKQANGSDFYYYKNVQAFATWCTNQRYITLYGG
jgi:hypothetical protein